MTVRLTKSVLLGLGLMALVGAGVLLWGVMGGNGQPLQTPEPAAHRTAAEASGLPRESVSTPAAPPSALPSVPINSAQDRVISDWTSAYRSRDPYPLVVALREARQKGTFAASFELAMGCLRGLLAISQPPDFLSGGRAQVDEYLDARLQAKSEIELRCTRFAGQDFHALTQPLAGDVYGVRYRQALDVLANGAASRRERDAVTEMVAQGMGAAHGAAGWLSEARIWKGESWQDRENEFDSAAFIARHVATAGPPALAADLRDLVGCYRGGPCKAMSSLALSSIPEDRRPVVESLARDMAASFRANDMTPWLPPKTAQKPGG